MLKAGSQAHLTTAIIVIWFYQGVFASQYATIVDHVLVGHVFTSFHSSGLFSCIEACQKQAKCISYNYKFTNPDGLCELNDHGIGTDCDGREILIYSPGFTFQQIKENKVIFVFSACLVQCYT